jgi:hypothetical protein
MRGEIADDLRLASFVHSIPTRQFACKIPSSYDLMRILADDYEILECFEHARMYTRPTIRQDRSKSAFATSHSFCPKRKTVRSHFRPDVSLGGLMRVTRFEGCPRRNEKPGYTASINMRAKLKGC